MTNIPLNDTNLILAFGALCSLLLTACVYIFATLNSKVDKLGSKIDAMEESSSKDHAIVIGRLGSLEASVQHVRESMGRTMDGLDDHEDRLSDVEKELIRRKKD